ncbi:Ion transport protein-domain-containing protein [Paraphysoderma sedebokerense]|nr:Ion transport protein-domain-containing protein [Paraphysoderma sedebokerense]
MKDIFILMVVFLLCWGITGTKLFGGKLRQRCVDLTGIVDNDIVCSMSLNSGYQCPADTTCEAVGRNPNYGTVSFDNVISSFLSIFQILSGEGWSEVLIDVKNSTNWASIIYFVSVIFIGNYVLIQLLVSVVITSLGSVIEESESSTSTADQTSLSSGEANQSRLSSSPSLPEIDVELKKEDVEKLGIIRRYAYIIVYSKFFDFFIMLTILVNTVALAAIYNGMPQDYARILDVINQCCTVIFGVEMTLKLVALLPFRYCKSSVNVMDGLVTIISIVDLAALTDQMMQISSTLTVFRVVRAFLRTLRLLRLMRLSKPLLRLVQIIVDAWPLLRSLFSIWFITGFVFACLGIQFFSGKLDFDPSAADGGRPRAHFDTFHYSSLSIFQLYSLENWNDIAVSLSRATGIWSTIFAVTVIIIGGFVLSQMLLAIIISAFQDELKEVAQRAKEKRSKMMKKLAAKTSVQNMLSKKVSKMLDNIEMLSAPPIMITATNASCKDLSSELQRPIDSETLQRKLEATVAGKAMPAPIRGKNGFRFSFIVEQKIVAERIDEAGSIDVIPTEEVLKVNEEAVDLNIESSIVDSVARNGSIKSQTSSSELSSSQRSNRSQLVPYREPVPPNTPRVSITKIDVNLKGTESLSSFITNSNFRRRLRQVVRSRTYFYLSVSIILASCIALALEGPIPERNPPILATLDIFFAVAFSVELLLRMFSFNLLSGEHAFLRSLWNWLDIVVVAISWITLSSANVPGLKSYRVLRIIRISKVVNLSRRLRIVTIAIFKTIPTLQTIIVPFMMFLFMAAVLGLNLFVGLGWQCNDDSVAGKADCTGSFVNPTTGQAEARRWLPYRFYYDDIFQSLLSVLVISFQEGWPDDMHRYMDVNGLNNQPRRDATVWSSLFFAGVQFIGASFFMAVVTGTIFDTLKHHQEKLLGLKVLTDEQRDRLANLRFLFLLYPPVPPCRPNSEFHRKVQHLVQTDRFRRFFIGIVAINFAFMTIDHSGAPLTLKQVLDISQYVFTGIYLLEVILVFYGVGRRAFFADNWNVLNLLIVMVAIADLIAQFASAANIFVILRIVRVFRLFRNAKGLNALALSVAVNFGQLLNVIFLIVVICFIYAVLGVQYFGKIKFVDGLSSEINFTDFPSAFLTVYVSTTGENWPGIMSNCMIQPPDCDLASDNCGAVWAPIYFISLQLLVNWILLNSFIAIVVDTFHHFIEHDATIQMIEQCVQNFNQLWLEYDPSGSLIISIYDLMSLYERLDEPLAHFGGRRIHIRNALREVPVYAEKLIYSDVIRRLFVTTFAKDLPSSFSRQLLKKKRTITRETEKLIKNNAARTFEEAQAVIVIQRSAKMWLDRRRMIREVNAGKRDFDPNLLKKPRLPQTVGSPQTLGRPRSSYINENDLNARRLTGVRPHSTYSEISTNTRRSTVDKGKPLISEEVGVSIRKSSNAGNIAITESIETDSPKKLEPRLDKLKPEDSVRTQNYNGQSKYVDNKRFNNSEPNLTNIKSTAQLEFHGFSEPYLNRISAKPDTRQTQPNNIPSPSDLGSITESSVESVHSPQQHALSSPEPLLGPSTLAIGEVEKSTSATSKTRCWSVMCPDISTSVEIMVLDSPKGGGGSNDNPATPLFFAIPKPKTDRKDDIPNPP